MVRKILLLSLAGAAGTLARYSLAGIVQRLSGSDFPFGTFAVNMAGCLLFGLVWGVLENRAGLSGEWRLVALVGFMGAFTTFSSYMYETAALLRVGQILLATANVAGQTAAGLGLMLLGMALGRLI